MCQNGAIGMAAGVQVGMATPSLHEFGSEELKHEYLAPAMRGEMVCSIAVTEPVNAGCLTHAASTYSYAIVRIAEISA